MPQVCLVSSLNGELDLIIGKIRTLSVAEKSLYKTKRLNIRFTFYACPPNKGKTCSSILLMSRYLFSTSDFLNRSAFHQRPS